MNLHDLPEDILRVIMDRSKAIYVSSPIATIGYTFSELGLANKELNLLAVSERRVTYYDWMSQNWLFG